jgi:hypothetical protein
VPAYAYYHNGGYKNKSASYKSHNSDNDESESEDDEPAAQRIPKKALPPTPKIAVRRLR